MSDPASRTLARAAAAFSLALERPVLLRGRRAVVVRAQAPDGPLIVKQFPPALRGHFLRERAGLKALSAVAELRGIVPGLLGESDASLILLIEDLAPQTGLGELISGTDPAAAEQALVAAAGRLGLLHGHARRQLLAFSALAPPAPTTGRVFADGQAATLALCRRVLGQDSPALAQALAALTRELEAAEGTLTTITSGDMAPSNVLLRASGPAFIDFEFCGVRHPFYDAMFWRCICPFPTAVTERMEEAYRQALAEAGLALADERFHRDMILHVSHRLFWGLGWIKQALFEHDQEFVPGVSTRWLTRRYLRDFLALAGRGPASADAILLAVAERLAQRLAQLWPASDPARELACFAKGAAAGATEPRD